MDMVIYGYVRISTMKQKIQRQIDNIKAKYPNAVIVDETYTGTTTDRPKWNRLLKQIKRDKENGNDVTLVFDEVSRMSRNADEGFALYEELFNLGINLVFLKEPHINTDTYKKALESNVQMTGTNIDYILEGINKYLLSLAKEQIRIAFEQAQKEVEYLHQRTSEAVRQAQLQGKQVGRAVGSKIETKKAKDMKAKIVKMSKDFEGSMSDKEIIDTLKIARNSYYKYKSELKAERGIE